jgi:hypothetical protein
LQRGYACAEGEEGGEGGGEDFGGAVCDGAWVCRGQGEEEEGGEEEAGEFEEVVGGVGAMGVGAMGVGAVGAGVCWRLGGFWFIWTRGWRTIRRGWRCEQH